MTIDEFEIGKKVLFCKEERVCVDKGSKGVTLSWGIHDPDNTDCWFSIGMSDFDDCVPIKAKEIHEDESAKRRVLWLVDKIENKLLTIQNENTEIEEALSDIKRTIQ